MGEKKHFLNIAQASLSEIDAQLEISCRLGFITQPAYDKAGLSMRDVYMLLSGLQRSIR